MAYHRKWRALHAEVQTLAADSSSSDENGCDIERLTGSQSDNDCSVLPHPTEKEHSEGSEVEFSDTVSVVSSDLNSDYDDDETSDSDNENEPSLSEEVAAWATKNKCTRSALNEMLDILRRQGHRLPKDGRTLLQTPQKVESVKKMWRSLCLLWHSNRCFEGSCSKPWLFRTDKFVDQR